MPHTEERDHFGSPSFRVGGKIFAQLTPAEKRPMRVLVKLSAADQAAWLMTDPETFQAEPSWGRHGWTYGQLDRVEAGLLLDLLAQSWRAVAPRERRSSGPPGGA